MRCLNFLFLFIIFFTCACEPNTKQDGDVISMRQANKIITAVPNNYKDAQDSSFHFMQDTLYFQNQFFSGHVFRLYPSKDTLFTGTYLNGLEEGAQQKWYSNNQLAEARNYHQGKKIGAHVGFWENGKPKFEYHFLNGEQHGIVREWYQNGKLYKFFHYENGYEVGSQKMWWENGVIRANYVVKNGRRYGLVGLKLCMNPNASIQNKSK